MKKRVRVSAALATGPTRTGNNSASSGTVSEATRHRGPVQTIADETGERARSGCIPDRDASTGHHAVHGAAYLLVCALPSSPASTADNHTRDSSASAELLAAGLSVFRGPLGAIDDENIDLFHTRFEPQAELFP